METNTGKDKYFAPGIDVVEIEGQGVLCESFFGNTEDYDNGVFSW